MSYDRHGRPDEQFITPRGKHWNELTDWDGDGLAMAEVVFTRRVLNPVNRPSNETIMSVNYTHEKRTDEERANDGVTRLDVWEPYACSCREDCIHKQNSRKWDQMNRAKRGGREGT